MHLFHDILAPCTYTSSDKFHTTSSALLGSWVFLATVFCFKWINENRLSINAFFIFSTIHFEICLFNCLHLTEEQRCSRYSPHSSHTHILSTTANILSRAWHILWRENGRHKVIMRESGRKGGDDENFVLSYILCHFFKTILPWLFLFFLHCPPHNQLPRLIVLHSVST